MCDTHRVLSEHIHVTVSIDRWTNVKVECDPSWQPFQGHCYRLQAEKRSWQESKRACLRGGGDLLSIHSMAELEFITKQIKQGEGWPGHCAGWRGAEGGGSRGQGRAGSVCPIPSFPGSAENVLSFIAGLRLISVSSLSCSPPLPFLRGGGAVDRPQ